MFVDCEKRLQSRQYIPGMLNKLIKINNGNAVSAFVFKEHLQSPELVEGSHILGITRKTPNANE